jgi:hypothetical protein
MIRSKVKIDPIRAAHCGVIIPGELEINRKIRLQVV